MRFLESDRDNYENIYYAGTGHMGLCDLLLASPILAGLLDQMRGTLVAVELHHDRVLNGIAMREQEERDRVR